MRDKNKKFRILLFIIGIIIILVCFSVYKKEMNHKLATEDADYILTSKVTESNSFNLTLKRSKHSGDLKSVNFMLVLSDDTELFNINKDNYINTSYEFSDKSILKLNDNKNSVSSLAINYEIPNILDRNIPYGFFHLVIEGNNDKYQYFTVVYYLNNDKVETQVLEADDVYNHTLISTLAGKISNYNNIDLDLDTLSNLLVKERENLKTELTK